MKNIKVIFSAFIVTIAVCGAYASKTFVPATGYIKINDGTPVSEECISIGTCANEGTFRCKGKQTPTSTAVDLFQLRGDLTACDVVINHTSPNSIN